MSSAATILSFDDVTFEHDAKKPILKNTSFAIRQGSKMTLMGQNGAGKSTLFCLITGEESNEIREITSASHVEFYNVGFDKSTDDLKEMTSYLIGDYIVIKNKKGEIQILIYGSCPSFDDFLCDIEEGIWLPSILGDTLIIELYSDSSDNEYGIFIDKYATTWFPEEEKIK